MKPPGIRVTVPDYFGDSYGEGDDRQWVERRQHIGRGKSLSDFKGLGELKPEEAFETICERLPDYIIAWNLTDESGETLPDPWKNPEAFRALAEDNWELMLWLSEVVTSPLALLVRGPKA